MEATNCIYRNPNEAIEARVRDLLSRMTLDQKIAQMTQIERRVATPVALTGHAIGTLSLLSLYFLFFWSKWRSILQGVF